jgi:hypothetical protein
MLIHPFAGVAKTQNMLDIPKVFAPCQTGVSTSKNVNLYFREPLTKKCVDASPLDRGGRVGMGVFDHALNNHI